MRAAIPFCYKQRVLERQKNKCNICSMFLDIYDIDHIIPFCVERIHRISNLQALCPTCHARKTRNEAKYIKIFKECQKTKSFRFCWKCKKVISSYFGFQGGVCMPCLNESFKGLHVL